jgi:hypothetical protein
MGAACRLGISLATARTYLRHVLDKTGAHHQAELVVSRCSADHADRSDAHGSLVFRGSFTHSFNLAKQRNGFAMPLDYDRLLPLAARWPAGEPGARAAINCTDQRRGSRVLFPDGMSVPPYQANGRTLQANDEPEPAALPQEECWACIERPADAGREH